MIYAKLLFFTLKSLTSPQDSFIQSYADNKNVIQIQLNTTASNKYTVFICLFYIVCGIITLLDLVFIIRHRLYKDDNKLRSFGIVLLLNIILIGLAILFLYEANVESIKNDADVLITETWRQALKLQI